MPIDQTIKNS